MSAAARPADRLGPIEDILKELVPRLLPAPGATRGRPPILPAAMLWTGLLVCILRGFSSQLQLWRLLATTGLWDFPARPISDDAVYRRLARTGPTVMHQLFTDVTAELLPRTPPDRTLPSFAREIVALDETTLDPVVRHLPTLRGVPRTDKRLLPGKLAGVFDVRRQLWRTLVHVPSPVQNEKVTARDLLATVPPGSLVLADLGYFGFRWFDDLTDQGYWWVSRQRTKTTTAVAHIAYRDGQVTDALVWLGAYRADRAKHLVRQVRVRVGRQEWTYLTNVTDPALLAVGDVVRLYARRWDIELAVKLVKRDLGLHLLWSARPEVILTQVWAVLLIAQIALTLRTQVAAQAGVDLFAVSLTLLLRDLPRFAAHGTRDPVAWLVEIGARTGYIRPSRRLVPLVPPVDQAAYRPPPRELERQRTPRYAGRTTPRICRNR